MLNRTHQVHVPAMGDLNKKYIIQISKNLNMTQASAIELILTKARTGKIVELRPVGRKALVTRRVKAGIRRVKPL